MRVKIRYVLDNDNWTDAQYEDAQDTDNIFIITDEMIRNLIYQNAPLQDGDYIDHIHFYQSDKGNE